MRAPAAGGGNREPGISAAVEKCEDQRKPDAFFGYRKVDAGCRCLTQGDRLRGSPFLIGPLVERGLGTGMRIATPNPSVTGASAGDTSPFRGGKAHWFAMASPRTDALSPRGEAKGVAGAQRFHS